MMSVEIGKLGTEMSSANHELQHALCLELPVEELLRRARPLPPHREMVLDDLTPEEGDAFLASLKA